MYKKPLKGNKMGLINGKDQNDDIEMNNMTTCVHI